MNNVLEDIRYDVKNWWWFLVTGLFFRQQALLFVQSPRRAI